MFKRWALAALALLPLVSAEGQTPYSLDREASALEFHAISFLHSFDAKVVGFNGRADVGEQLTHAQGTLLVDVASIDTGLKKRNEEMFKLLEQDKHPKIEFKLKSAKLLPNMTADGRVIDELKPGESKCALSGELKVRGRVAPVEGRGLCKQVSEAHWSVEGEAPVDINAYGIESPNIAFIKLEPIVTVRYKLEFKRAK